MTALLFAIAAAEGRVAYTDPVGKFFHSNSRAHSSLKIFHLLNCSHGLDGSALECIPYTRNGLFDAEKLWFAVNDEPPISLPGEHFYYYGNVGMWLAAAILERLYQSTYASLLKAKLLCRIDAESRVTDSCRICPASGGFQMSANELLRLCRFHLESHCDTALFSAIQLLRERFHLRLPVWSNAGLSSGVGWFRYLGSSYGHFSRTSATSSLILIAPAARSAMVLTGLGGSTASMAQHSVTGPLLSPRDLSKPRLLTMQNRRELPIERIAGLYCKSRLALEITSDVPGRLRASFYSRNNRQFAPPPEFVTDLLPKAEDTFFPAIPDLTLIPYLKLSGHAADGRYSHAFTGMHTFRRVH
jgi:hypothetical protein